MVNSRRGNNTDWNYYYYVTASREDSICSQWAIWLLGACKDSMKLAILLVFKRMQLILTTVHGKEDKNLPEMNK